MLIRCVGVFEFRKQKFESGRGFDNSRWNERRHE